MAELRSKEPLLAVMLSLLLPGLGQVYSNKAKRGLILLAIDIILGMIFYAYFFNPVTRVTFVTIVSVIIIVTFGFYIHFDAYKCAKELNINNNLAGNYAKGKRVLIVFGIIFLVFVFNPFGFLVASYIKKNFVQSFKLPSDSMRPTLFSGDAILVDKRIYKKSDPSRGDVVAFISPQDKRKLFGKRIVGLPGETLEIKEGKILINAVPVTQPIIGSLNYVNRGEFAAVGKPVTIPRDSYFVLGDNSMASLDSRYWGFVPRRDLIGKAYKIYFPTRRSGPIN